MNIYHSLKDFSATNAVVTIGMFDGVHVGHRALLQHVMLEASVINGESVVLTFWPHPQVFFGKTHDFKMLSTLDEKLSLLAEIGIDHCIILPFTHEFSQYSAHDYVVEILHKGIGASKVIIGYDHRYGKHGQGDFALMKSLGIQLGFDVQEIPAFTLEQVNISSTKVRHALQIGDVHKAGEYLSYTYSIAGTVQQGRKIGRTIGIPTANVLPESEYKPIPAIGVYVTRVLYNNVVYKSVTSVGLNPTIDEHNTKPTIEVHLLDFDSDLYNQYIRVYFVERIRDEQKYDSLQELQSAIKHDIEIAKRILK